MEDDKELKNLINKYEGAKLEHKSKDFLLKTSKEIAKKIGSFINAEGGKLLIGVKDRKPDDLIFSQKDEERITQICRDRIKPPQKIDIHTCKIDNKTIAIIDIIPSRAPVQANDKYYIRVGSTTRLMTPEEIKKKCIEADKKYETIDIKDANDIINQIQLNRDIILDENQKKKQYLTLDSISGPLIGGKNIIYGNLYENFNEKSKIIFTTIHSVTIEELTKILSQYYKIFEKFSYETSAFSFEQRGFNWVGLGPRDFIKTVQDQKKRYKSIQNKYGEDFHIHHRESALFIDEIRDGIFFISCEPNYRKNSDSITIDYFDIGFVLKEQPFSRLFNEFSHLINIEPFTLYSNDNQFIMPEYISISSKIPFKVNGFIQSIRTKNDDEHTWVSGAYGKLPKQLLKLGLNQDIIVNIRHHTMLEDDFEYYIDRIKYTKFELGCFSAAIVSIDVDW